MYLAVRLGVASCLQLVEDVDFADPQGPKISFVVKNAQKNIVDFFVDFTLKEGRGPNFFLPVGELYSEVPAGRFDAYAPLASMPLLVSVEEKKRA